MGKPSPASRRAALQAQRDAEARAARRSRWVAIALGGALALLLVVGGALWWNHHNRPAATPVGTQVKVPDATADGSGMVLYPTPKGKPTLVIYEDYQCPWCKKGYDNLDAVEKSAAEKGEIGVEVHTITLLDTMLKNDSSQRANIAAACASVVGHYDAYYDTLFQNYPAKEGDGFTDEQLRVDFPAKAGITGSQLTTFQQCYDQRQTNDAVQKVLDEAKSSGRDDSTPTYWVRSASGRMTKVDDTALHNWVTSAPTEQSFLASVEAAA